MDSILGLIVLVAFVYICAKYSGNVERGRAAYAAHARHLHYKPSNTPEWLPGTFEDGLRWQEHHLDQQIKAYEEYLAEHPSPPKVAP